MDDNHDNSPFAIPELRARLARFVAPKDALRCILVNKAWANTFLYLRWHTVDFKKHENILLLPRSAILRNCHWIHVATNAKELSHVSWLAIYKIVQLQELSIHISSSSLQQRAYCFDVISRNSSALKTLTIQSDIRRDFPDPRLLSISSTVPASVLVPHVYAVPLLTTPSTTTLSSRMCSLTLTGLCMLREDFSTVLQGSPLLETLSLIHMILVGLPHTLFRHARLWTLISELSTVFQPDYCNKTGTQVPLLIHFPKLKRWCLSGVERETSINAAKIKENVNKHCEKLNTLELHFNSGGNLATICRGAFSNLTSICFRYTSISPDLVMAFLAHQETLQQLWTDSSALYNNQHIIPANDHFQDQGSQVQLLPIYCSRLTIFWLPNHEMDINLAEKSTWSCKNLKSLRIRIKDLDTMEKIEAVIARWDSMKSIPEHIPETIDMSIEARVARFLFKFKRLNSVWLGGSIWSLS